MDLIVRDGAVVTFHYELSGEDGTVLDDSAERGEPMHGLIGTRFLVPGLDRALRGRHAGESFEVVLPPDQAYGVRKGGPLPVPRTAFPDDAELTPGVTLTTRTPDGRPMVLWVDRVEGSQVWVDPHHPLAGRTLRYRVQILSVRTATPAELAAGRPLTGVAEA
jgi:FKBP-type peptidyl-prolyl cis-trans isomerase SlyD